MTDPSLQPTNAPLLTRLTDAAAHGQGSLEARAGDLLRSLPKPTPLSNAARLRIEERLLGSGSGPGPGGGEPGLPLRTIGIGAAAVTAAAVAALLFLSGGPASRRGLPLEDKPQPVREQRPPIQPAAPVAELEPAPAPLLPGEMAAPATQPARINRATAHPRLAMNAAAPAVAPSPNAVAPVEKAAPPASEESLLLAESRLLGVALHQIHQEHDAQAALRSLADYQTRFPSGMLFEEAQAARVDALLLLDHRAEALSLLDQASFVRLARGGELRVVRGELRSTAGRCREAVADFSWALTHQPTPAMAERALYGRAACAMQGHDSATARANFGLYLEQFPSGRFAQAAQRALDELKR